MANAVAPKPDPPKDSTAIVTVNIDDFTRTRDSVIVALATLQSAVSDLSKAYINHANTVLNRGPSTLDLGGITNSLLENGLLSVVRPHSPAGEGEVKKKRKRAPPDPNAPKRALTPYFLYMQHNRKQIAAEMGKDARPKDVADEGTKRWAAMDKEERDVWQTLYKQNLDVYHAKMKAYKAGLPVPEDEATKDAAAAQLQLHEEVRQATEDRSSEDSSSSSDEEEEEETSPEPAPAPEPTPPRSSKRRRTGDAKTLPIRAPSPPKVAPPKKSSPEKKKRGAKAAAEEKTKRAPVVETPKVEKRTRKKRKSEANASED